jgi:predicted dehydrogenase
MPAPKHVSRRRFVQTVATAGIAGPTILASLSRGALNSAPSDRINVGFIGIGRQGRGHLQRFANYPDVQVVAVCDVVAERRDDAKQLVEKQYAQQKGQATYRGCDAYNDFRELLARKDIDAVLIATPDHWHAIPAIAAARAGKDIYCEKPLTRTIAEGRALVKAVDDAKVVFQTGSQQRTEFGGRFRQAVELVRNGYLGDIKTVRIGVGGPAVACDLPTEPIPAGTDWEMWQGPAAERGYNQILCPQGVHNHFPAWRKYKEYAGGALADMGAHHFDIAQWALGTDGTGPTSIEPPSDPSATTGLKFTYANGVEMFHGGPNGCTFEGTKGTLYVDRPKIESNPANIATHVIGPDEKHVYHADNQHRDWLDCIRSRKTPICSAEIGHRSCSICLLGNIGYWLHRPLTWDPVKEVFANDDEANKLVVGQMRSPWTL